MFFPQALILEIVLDDLPSWLHILKSPHPCSEFQVSPQYCDSTYGSYSDLCADVQALKSSFLLGTRTLVSHRQLKLPMFMLPKQKQNTSQPAFILSKWYHHPCIYRSQRSGSHLHTPFSYNYPIQSLTITVQLYILHVSSSTSFHLHYNYSDSKYSYFFTRFA